VPDAVLVLSSHSPLPEELGDLLREEGASGIWEVSLTEWRAYFAAEDRDLPSHCAALFPDVHATWRHEETVDWAARYQASLRPLCVGRRFVILPSPDLQNPWPGRLPIRLVPGMAFGTGEHFTTSSCLEALESLAPIRGPVLDVGCGSGILSAGSLLLGAPRAVACDVDRDACRVAADTARANGLAYRVVAGSADAVAGRFSVVVANILAETLVEILPALNDRLALDGCLIGSGIMHEKGDAVLQRAQQLELRLKARRTDGNWWTFLWRREQQANP